jgi:hypothetical protein
VRLSFSGLPRRFPPPHSFLCLHASCLVALYLLLFIVLHFFAGSLGFPVKQTKIVDFFGIQKNEQDAQPAKWRLSQGNSFLPPACTIALHNLISYEMRDHFPSLRVLDDP